jgi:tetrahydromethanopterin S-methyltransferase subunit G
MADTTLKDVIREVKSETPDNSPKDTKGVSQSSSETKSGETEEYVAGVKISDFPEQERAIAKKVLEAKAKLLESGVQKKFQEIAKFKKAQDDLISMGLSVDEAQDVLQKHIEQKRNPQKTTAEKKEAVKTLDKLISDAPYEQRQPLEQMRQIILEETNVSSLQKKVDDLEKMVSYFRTKDMQLGEKTLTDDLASLEQKFGKDLIEKYSDEVKSEWRKYPNSKAKDILKYVVPDDEYEQALLSRKTKVKEKVEASVSIGSGITSSSEAINTKGKWKDTLRQVLKAK